MGHSLYIVAIPSNRLMPCYSSWKMEQLAYISRTNFTLLYDIHHFIWHLSFPTWCKFPWDLSTLLWSVYWSHWSRNLTHKHLEMHGCIISTVLKHQAISIHSADFVFIMLTNIDKKKIHLQWTTQETKITFEKTRTIRTSALWAYPLPPHDYPYYWWVILDPKSNEDIVKVANLKNSPKFQNFYIETNFIRDTHSEVAW